MTTQNMIRGRSNVVTLTNNSGGALIAGDVCVQDTSADEKATTTTSAASVLKVFVAAESIASGAAGKFYESGYCPLVNVNASVTRGRFLFTHTVAKQAAENATYGSGAFGKILKSGTTPSAIIYSATAQISGSGVTRSGSTTDGHLAVWDGSNADSIKDGGAVSSGRVLIAENTPTGTGTTSFTSIPGTYTKLIIEFAIRSTQAATSVSGYMQFNTDTTASNYRGEEHVSGANQVPIHNAFATYQFTTGITGGNGPSNEFSIGKCEIIQYANTGFNKHALFEISHKRDVSALFVARYESSLAWISTTAITQIDVVLSAGNYAANSVLRLYGDS